VPQLRSPESQPEIRNAIELACRSRDCSCVKVVSLNVGEPREVQWQGKMVSTGIFKEAVTGRVMMRRLNLDGDRQADLTVHGGVDKAVYAYPSEHYAFWRGELPGVELPWGMFGENLTTEGLSEDSVFVGDRFQIGEAEGVVTQPRMPCYKLGIKFGRADMVKRFLTSRRTGFYFAVTREGMVGAGDCIQLVSRDQKEIRVSDITRLYAFEKNDTQGLGLVIELKWLPDSWKEHFRKQLDSTKSRS
jgi:MOSC domain-containing protein YiiM